MKSTGMKIMSDFKLGIVGILLTCFLVAGVAVDYIFAQSDNIYEEIQRFDKVLIKIDQNYVQEVPPSELVDAAIEGMRTVLDPHTAYFKEDDYDELMVHTKAEFGGLGITISIRDNILTVVSPLPGTPASKMGIMAGDRILKINGVSTGGITVEQAVKKLRGQPGTEVTITIEREGEKETVDYTITRAIIHIKSVPYSGVLHDSIGYIRLVSFSKESGREIEEAIQKLNAGRLRGLVLDLRNNPGGLLPAAIEVAEKILGKDRMVVYTRGRMKGQNEEYKTEASPALDPEKLLVVLVNEGSASASEIVAGAIQDWDRGIIIGRETYGKGSVQTVLPLGLGKNCYLKLTTAHYYTPSGRCINKPENEVKGKRNRFVEDEIEPPDSIVAENKDAKTDSSKPEEIFRTKAGRKVFGGGGIEPDITLAAQKLERLEEVLERKTLFFKFAVKKIAKLREKNAVIQKDFKITDAMIEEFRKFAETEKIEYKTNSQRSLTELQKSFEREYGDSAGEYKSDAAVIASAHTLFKQMQAKIEAEKKLDFNRSKEYIRRSIKREVIASAMGEDAWFEHILTYDPQVAEAAKLIQNKNQYQAILTMAK